MKKILVLCTGNSCRSQMAEGYLRQFAGDHAEIFSAGVETHGVNPIAVMTMMEDGIDISLQTSNHVKEYDHIEFDMVLTVCDHAQSVCPVLPGNARKFHHSFPDPAKVRGTEDEILESFREVRNMIKEYCFVFVADHVIAEA